MADTRHIEYLKAWLNEGAELPDYPRSRREKYLANIVGIDGVDIPNPEAPEDFYYLKIIENGGAGGGGKAVIEPLEITENGAYYEAGDGVDGFSPVSVNIPEMRADGVNFIDYDGTVIATYAKNAWLEELPTPPEHDGLIFQGWNYTLEELQDFASFEAAPLVVGALYNTEGGAIRIKVRAEADGTVRLRFTQSGAPAVIDWGDGTIERNSTVPATVDFTHTYLPAGAPYTITISKTAEATAVVPGQTGNDTSFIVTSADVHVESVNIGDIATTWTTGALKAIDMAAISLHGGFVGSASTLRVFQYCAELSALVLPRTIAMGQYFCDACYSLARVSLPPTISELPMYAFQKTGIEIISAPNAAIIWTNAFNECTKLRAYYLPKVASLGGTNFASTTDMAVPVAFPMLTSLGANTFYRSGITIAHLYGVESIGASAFSDCYRLTDVFVPAGTTEIQQKAFFNCTALKSLYMAGATPPTLGFNALNSTPSTLVISVPAGAGDAYKAATNWSAYADKIVERPGS